MKLSVEELKKKYKFRDRVVRVISVDGKFRCSLIVNSTATKTAQAKHELSIVPAFFQSRAMSAASLLASFLKGEERIILETNSNGVISKVYAEASQNGEIRSYVDYDHKRIETEINRLEDALGLGLLNVSRILFNNTEPISGVVPLQRGDIATDLAYYFIQSEQIPTSVILDVDFDDDGTVKSSGGLLVQAMPGATDSDLQKIVDSMTEMEKLSQYIEREMLVPEIMKEVLPFEFNILSSVPVDFFCRCSKEQFVTRIMTLGLDEVKSMKVEGHNEAVCRYCNNKYYLTDKDFEGMIQDLRAKRN
ncbi:MAG: Hsp33 family molecular chaperone HslO [Candidatus Kapabacteria bacterium]|nr:Hsp33 family molecular chaperone HslO [Candidatus Kapabacteria bacterium]